MHTLTPAQVQHLRSQLGRTDVSAHVLEKLRWILHYCDHGFSVSETCRAFRISRSTFHRWLERFDPQDIRSLEERSHEPLSVRQPSVPAHVVALIRAYRERSPHIGKERIAKLLLDEHGVVISASSVGRCIERECLYFGKSPLHWKKRMADAAAVAPAVQDVPSEKDVPGASAAHVSPDCCSQCVAARRRARMLRNSLVLASVLVNIAFLGSLVLTAFWESAGPRIQADLSQESIYPDFVLP